MRSLTFWALTLTVVLACTPQSNAPSPNRDENEAAAREFQDLAHSFDYAGLRAVTIADFEFLIFGRRMNLYDFEAMLREMEASRNGKPLGSYEISSFHTRIIGDVAYSSWLSEDWLESSIFVRVGDRWRPPPRADMQILVYIY